MVKTEAFDKGTVISELSQGRDFANQLKQMIHPALASGEACGSLLESIVSNIDNALSLLNCMDLIQNGVASISNMTESLQSNAYESEAYSVKARVPSKKRKAIPRRGEQVEVCLGTGTDQGQPEDGYYWRKYGQKDILRANHPRAYYRCTHRDSQGCLATKQVQRKDENPSIFEVIYIGKHTCIQERLKRLKQNPNDPTEQPQQHNRTHSQETNMVRCPDHLKVEQVQEMGSLAPFPSPSGNTKPHFFTDQENIIESSCSPPFPSPATPQSYISQTSFEMPDFGMSYIDACTSESELLDMILNPTPSMSDFPSAESDLWIGLLDLDSF